MSPAQLRRILGFVAAALGLLEFIWGFLDWVEQTGANDGVSGYASGALPVGFGLLAGLLALAEQLDDKSFGLLPAAAAVASLLTAFGQMVGEPDGVDVEVGLILTLVTAILQVGVLVYLWLAASGKLPAPRPQHPGGPAGFGGAPAFGPPPGQQQGPPQGYGPPPPGYGPPPQ